VRGTVQDVALITRGKDRATVRLYFTSLHALTYLISYSLSHSLLARHKHKQDIKRMDFAVPVSFFNIHFQKKNLTTEAVAITTRSGFLPHPKKTLFSSKEQTASNKMSPPTILTKVFDAAEATYTGLLKFTARVVSSPMFPSRLC
jgi:hypothetical protein